MTMQAETAAAIEKIRRNNEGQPSPADIERIKQIEHRQRTVRKIFKEDEDWMQDMLQRYPIYFNDLMERGRGGR